jgi:hypothetical protein
MSCSNAEQIEHGSSGARTLVHKSSTKGCSTASISCQRKPIWTGAVLGQHRSGTSFDVQLIWLFKHACYSGIAPCLQLGSTAFLGLYSRAYVEIDAQLALSTLN